MTPALAGLTLASMPGAARAWRAAVDARQWRAGCEAAAATGGRLAALWASDDRDRSGVFTVRALLAVYEGLVCLELAVPEASSAYPEVSDLFPCAARMQRAATDLLGVRAVAPDGSAMAPGAPITTPCAATRRPPARAATATGATRSCPCPATACTKSRSGRC